jgi:hypothetical protein
LKGASLAQSSQRQVWSLSPDTGFVRVDETVGPIAEVSITAATIKATVDWRPAIISLTHNGRVFDGGDNWLCDPRGSDHFDLTADSTITTMTGTKNNRTCSPSNVQPVTVTRQ